MIEAQQRGIATLQAIASKYPEVPDLGRLDVRKLPSVVAAMEAKNPARAREFVNDLRAVDQIVGQYKQATNAKAQHTNNEFTRWSRAEDQKFSAKHSGDANFREVATGVVNVLRDHGIDPQEFAALASKPEGSFLRDARVQGLLYQLSKSAMAKSANLQDKRLHELPPVQRRGTTAPGGHRAISGAALTSKLNAALAKSTGEAALRAGAAILNARRNGR